MSKPGKMMVGTLRLRLVIRGSRSLKDKRRTVKSIKDRVSHRFNASIAEVGSLESHQCAELGVAVVANEADYIRSVLSRITHLAGTLRDAELASCEMEVL